MDTLPWFLGRHSRNLTPGISWDFQLNGLHEGSDQVIMIMVLVMAW